MLFSARLNLLHRRAHQHSTTTLEDGGGQGPGQRQWTALGEPGAIHIVRHNHGMHREGGSPETTNQGSEAVLKAGFKAVWWQKVDCMHVG